MENEIKWGSCSTCKYYKVCGGSNSNPKYHPCKGGTKKAKTEEIKVLRREDIEGTGLAGFEHDENGKLI